MLFFGVLFRFLCVIFLCYFSCFFHFILWSVLRLFIQDGNTGPTHFCMSLDDFPLALADVYSLPRSLRSACAEALRTMNMRLPCSNSSNNKRTWFSPGLYSIHCWESYAKAVIEIDNAHSQLHTHEPIKRWLCCGTQNDDRIWRAPSSYKHRLQRFFWFCPTARNTCGKCSIVLMPFPLFSLSLSLSMLRP